MRGLFSIISIVLCVIFGGFIGISVKLHNDLYATETFPTLQGSEAFVVNSSRVPRVFNSLNSIGEPCMVNTRIGKIYVGIIYEKSIIYLPLCSPSEQYICCETNSSSCEILNISSVNYETCRNLSFTKDDLPQPGETLFVFWNQSAKNPYAFLSSPEPLTVSTIDPEQVGGDVAVMVLFLLSTLTGLLLLIFLCFDKQESASASASAIILKASEELDESKNVSTVRIHLKQNDTDQKDLHPPGKEAGQ